MDIEAMKKRAQAEIAAGFAHHHCFSAEDVLALVDEVERLKKALEVALDSDKSTPVWVARVENLERERDEAREQLRLASVDQAQTEAEANDLRDKIEEALALHKAVKAEIGLPAGASPRCATCKDERWPCPTRKALTGGRKK